MSTWYFRAVTIIHRATADLPDSATLTDRKRAIDAAWEWGERTNYPYREWLKARTDYLKRFGYKRGHGPLPRSPLDRAKWRATAKARAAQNG